MAKPFKVEIPAQLCYWGKDRKIKSHDHESVTIIGWQDDVLHNKWVQIQFRDETYAWVLREDLIIRK